MIWKYKPNKLFPPQVVFGHGVYHNRKEIRTSAKYTLPENQWINKVFGELLVVKNHSRGNIFHRYHINNMSMGAEHFVKMILAELIYKPNFQPSFLG